jgi:hypothetical protein
MRQALTPHSGARDDGTAGRHRLTSDMAQSRTGKAAPAVPDTTGPDATNADATDMARPVAT